VDIFYELALNLNVVNSSSELETMTTSAVHYQLSSGSPIRPRRETKMPTRRRERHSHVASPLPAPFVIPHPPLHPPKIKICLITEDLMSMILNVISLSLRSIDQNTLPRVARGFLSTPSPSYSIHAYPPLLRSRHRNLHRNLSRRHTFGIIHQL